MGGDIPWATVKDFNSDRISASLEQISLEGLKHSAAKLVPSGTVLLVTRVGLGKVAITDIDIAINQDIKALLPCEDVWPEFLFWVMKRLAPEIETLGNGATVKGVTVRDIQKIDILLPSVKEQRRIANILNRAARIERLCAQASGHLRDFISALFIKMFGDPIENQMEWSVCALGTLGSLDRGRSQHRPRNAPKLYGGRYPFVQTGDVAASGGLITGYSQTYSEAGLAQSRIWPAGTLCITIAANIGMTGILDFDACFPDSIVGFAPRNLVTVEFVQTTLELMRTHIEKHAPQAAQRNINLKVLRELKIPVPPYSLQKRYSDTISHVRRITTSATTATATSSCLSASLAANLLRPIPNSPITHKRMSLI